MILIFSMIHFVSLGVSEENAALPILKRNIIKRNSTALLDSAHIEIAAHETVSEPSTSGMSRSDSYASVISAVGPLRAATPHKKSNRGPKPQQITVVTSSENVAVLKERQQKRKIRRKIIRRKR